MSRPILLILIGLLPAALLPAQDAPDHPLLTRYAGSTVVSRNVEAFGRYQLATGISSGNQVQGRALEGKVTRFVYQNPASRSTLEIFRNYETALRAAGLQPIFTCALDTCGPAYARSAWGRFNNLFVAADGDPRYLAGSITTATGTAYVAVMVGRTRSQLDIVEITGMETGMVSANADSLARDLERDGRATVGGIFFDTDSATLKPESKPALDELARLMKERADLRLLVVGHTDISGDLARNQALSEARARAVMQALVSEHGIEAARLAAFGVGPLAPAATNATAEGRSLNRRVEVVARR